MQLGIVTHCLHASRVSNDTVDTFNNSANSSDGDGDDCSTTNLYVISQLTYPMLLISTISSLLCPSSRSQWLSLVFRRFLSLQLMSTQLTLLLIGSHRHQASNHWLKNGLETNSSNMQDSRQHNSHSHQGACHNINGPGINGPGGPFMTT